VAVHHRLETGGELIVASPLVGGLTRVTIVAPRGQADLALPSGVALASLLPVLLMQTGTDVRAGGPENAWALSRLGGQVLDTGRTPAQLDVRDGELLYLTPTDKVAPEVVFDDVIDAVATATQRRAGRWGLVATHRFSAALGAIGLLGVSLLLLLAGPPHRTSAVAALGTAVLLAAVAMVLARTGRSSQFSTVCAAFAVLDAGIGGLLLLAGDRPLSGLSAPDVLLAATAMVVCAAAVTLAVAVNSSLFLSAAAAGVVLGLTAVAGLTLDATPAASAAVVAAVSFAVIPQLPMISYRLARLPIPSVPTGPEDLKTDTETVNGSWVMARTERAYELLTGFFGAIAGLALGCEVVLALTGGVAGLVLCADIALLLLLRARPMLSVAQRIPVLCSGAAGLVLVVAGVAVASGPAVRASLLVAVVLLASLLTLWYGTVVAGRRIAPTWGRLLDTFEVVLVLGLVPFAGWVCGLFGAIRGLSG
jgi:type VII secretion integral membrane protein EccD